MTFLFKDDFDRSWKKSALSLSAAKVGIILQVAVNLS